MAHRSVLNHTTRAGFSMIELVVVLAILAVVSGLAIPRLNLSQYRADGAAQQVRSVFMTAQRTSLTRQYDVIVSVDTIQNGLRIAEDVNNDGSIQVSEWKFWRPLGEGNRFSAPPVGYSTTSVATAVYGGSIRTVDAMPSIIFHRDGSASSDGEVYVSSLHRGRTDYRVVTVSRATGRTELLRLAGSGSGATWQVVQ